MTVKHVLILWGLMTLSVSAQKTKTFEQDTLAFRTYLSDNIGTTIDVQRLINIYNRLNTRKSGDKEIYRTFPAYLGDGFSYSGPVFHSDAPDAGEQKVIVTWKNWGGHWSVDNARFPDSLRMGLIHDARAYRDGKDMNAEKARLVENLRKFDAASDNKPIFFATIYAQYKGDIEKYVDDLYSKSIMGSKWRMGLFCRWPSAKKLQEDLSVQFAIGLALYDLWIKQGRTGDSSEVGRLVMAGGD